MAEAQRDPGLMAQRSAWVERVLGVMLSHPSDVQDGPAGMSDQDIMSIWWEAKDAMGQQIEALRRAFLATGHPQAQLACEKGLGAFTGGVLSRFQAAVIDRRNAPPADKEAAAAKLERHASQLAGFVLGNRMLPLLEANPFGVDVTIRRDVPTAVARILALAGPR